MNRTLALAGLALALSACDGIPPEARTPYPGEDAAPEAAASAADAPTERVDYQAELPPSPPGHTSTFEPPARGAYPEGAFGDAVRRGETLFTDTASVAGQYMGNTLSCSNCHLDDGRRADSAPMWAAWTKYPAYRRKNDHVNSIEERLRGCFTYSLDAQHSEVGRAPGPGDPMLTDLQAYLYWLSTDVPIGKTMPGRGYPELDKPEGGYDADRGQAVYEARCAVCHGTDGQGAEAEGETVFPPLWGEGSYNWGAGMHRINTAAGFIWANMPLGQPESLTEAEAWDVAAYINSQPRPGDPRFEGDVAATDETFHSHACRYGDTEDGQTLGRRLH